MIKKLNKIGMIRNMFGLTQLDICRESGLSLASVQNVETGKANPSISTLEALADCLGLELHLVEAPPNWENLVICGLPLQVELSSKAKASLTMLKRDLRRIVIQENLSERESDALTALLWAIEDHYPSIFTKYFSGKAFLIYSNKPKTGKLIKLRRNALAVLGTYL